RVTEIQTFGILVNNLQRARARSLELQQRVSTGKQVQQPSDDPGTFNHILHDKTSVAAIEQRLRNISFGQTRLDLSDRILMGVADSLTRAQELAVQFRSDTNGLAERIIGSAEVRQLFAHLQQSANTELNGQPIFTGTSTHGRATGLPISVPATLTDGVNDSVTLYVDGVQSGAIDLTAGAETLTGQELAARLQSRINADAAVVSAGKSVTVTFETDHLVIASDGHGPSSRVAVVAGTARSGLGLDGGSSTTGDAPFALTATVSPSSGNTGGAIAGQGRVVDLNVTTLDDYVVRFTSAASYEVLDVTVPVTVVRNTSNTGDVGLRDAGIVSPQQLTLHDYSIQFTSPTQYSVLDVTAGTTVSAGNTFISSVPIEFDGLRIILANGEQGGPQTGDTFAVSMAPRTVLANQPYASGQPITFDGLSLTVTDDGGTPAAGDLFAVVTGMQYQGDDGVHAIEVGPEQTVPTNLPGNRLFVSRTVDMFATVKQLVRSLRTNDRTGIAEALGGLNGSISHLGTMQGEIGALSNRMTVSAEQLDSAKSFYIQMLSQTEDVDLAKAISDLTLQQYAIEAASRTLNQVFENSLLNYLR
ncbi:MAG: flagellin, partial [Nitrospira sp.]|nr:flagellin [Nitrospira sp.]